MALYQELLKRAEALAGGSPQDTNVLAAAKARARVFEGHAAAAAKRLGIEPSDELALHVATLKLAAELLQAKMISGQPVDPADVIRLDAALKAYLPTAELPELTVKFVEGSDGPLVEHCRRCGWEPGQDATRTPLLDAPAVVEVVPPPPPQSPQEAQAVVDELKLDLVTLQTRIKAAEKLTQEWVERFNAPPIVRGPGWYHQIQPNLGGGTVGYGDPFSARNEPNPNRAQSYPMPTPKG
jgi:hypothetical protein